MGAQLDYGSAQGSAALSDLNCSPELASEETLPKQEDLCSFIVNDRARSPRCSVSMSSWPPLLSSLVHNEAATRSDGRLKRKHDGDLNPYVSKYRKVDEEENMEIQPENMETQPETTGHNGLSISADLSIIVGSDNKSTYLASSEKRSKPDDSMSKSSKDTSHYLHSPELPAAIWQHIFTFVPPLWLGRLLLVNRAFNSYLTYSGDTSGSVLEQDSIPQPISGNAVWSASRRRFCPGLPRPITGMAELAMWRLLRGQDCQTCNNANAAPSPCLPWEPGPGLDGVRIVWAFGLRCCGSCLMSRSKKEVDLSLSSEFPFFLLQALPFALVSQTRHYISHLTLRNSQTPSNVSIAKHYYIPQLAEIEAKFAQAKELGAASAEEWTKGLHLGGQQRIEETIRWEQWEARGGLLKVNPRPQLKPIVLGPVSKENRSLITTNGANPDRSTPSSIARDRHRSPEPLMADKSSIVAPPTPIDWKVPAPLPGGYHHGRQARRFRPRPERVFQDVKDAKAARRAEIERRCAALDPALLPGILNHMDSFQAAIQISQPLTELAWNVLRPRLLAQVSVAQQKERECKEQCRLLEEESRQQRQKEAQSKGTKDGSDRNWDTLQGPIRNRIGPLADRLISDHWDQGQAVTKETSPDFAADILIRVRQQFYAAIAKEDQEAVAAGRSVEKDLPNKPPTRILLLENMKWLFEFKIKTLTDRFHKELFLCHGCNGNFRYYSFEGVVQHYAAKHTTLLSMGTVVVHWRAEWPEYPLFQPKPSTTRSEVYNVPDPPPLFDRAFGPQHIQGVRINRDPVRDLGHGNSVHSSSDQRWVAKDISEANSIAQRQYFELSGLSHTISGPEQALGVAGQTSGIRGTNVYSNPQPSTSSSDLCSYRPIAQSLRNQMPVMGPSFGNPLAHNLAAYSSPYQQMPLPHISPRLAYASKTIALGPDLYRRQMDEMAKHAKEVFVGIGGIKELPGSVRIHVTIQHTVSRFKAIFPAAPSLAMFIDGLERNPVMRPVRSVNGIACKICVRNGLGASSSNQIHGVLIGDRRLYTLPHLVNHFRKAHMETSDSSETDRRAAQSGLHDWKFDMIELPELPVISNLIHAFGMTETKLSLITSVFPEAFADYPEDVRNTGSFLGHSEDTRFCHRAKQGTANGVSSEGVPFQILRNCDQDRNSPNNAVQTNLQAFPSDQPREDEYDPHRPLLGRIIKLEPREPQKSVRQSGQNFLQEATRNSLKLQVTEAEDTKASNARESLPKSTHEDDHTAQYDQSSRLAVAQYESQCSAIQNGDSLELSSIRESDKRTRQKGVFKQSSKQARHDPRPRSVHRCPLNYGLHTRSAPAEIDAVDKPPSTRSPIVESEEIDRDIAYAQQQTATINHWQTTHPSGTTHLDKSDTYYGWQKGVPRRKEDNRSRSADQMDSNSLLEDSFETLIQPLHRAAPRHYSNAYSSPKPERKRSYYSPTSMIYENGQQSIGRKRQSNDRSPLYHGSRYYEDVRAEPPARVASETLFYRTRSPAEEENRRDPLYHIYPPPGRKNGSSPKIYEYEYVDEQDKNEQRQEYHQRFEYLPIRSEDEEFSEPARYIISHTRDQTEVPAYFRHAQDYAADYAAYPPYRGTNHAFSKGRISYLDE